MSVPSVISQGFGSFANAFYVITDGFGDFGAPPAPPAAPSTTTNIIQLGGGGGVLKSPTRGSVIRAT